jgi:hypothetical protein
MAGYAAMRGRNIRARAKGQKVQCCNTNFLSDSDQVADFTEDDAKTVSKTDPKDQNLKDNT